jgi:DNA-binding transcriptional regulator YhcF (GntR family)
MAVTIQNAYDNLVKEALLKNSARIGVIPHLAVDIIALGSRRELWRKCWTGLPMSMKKRLM